MCYLSHTLRSTFRHSQYPVSSSASNTHPSGYNIFTHHWPEYHYAVHDYSIVCCVHARRQKCVSWYTRGDQRTAVCNLFYPSICKCLIRSLPSVSDLIWWWELHGKGLTHHTISTVPIFILFIFFQTSHLGDWHCKWQIWKLQHSLYWNFISILISKAYLTWRE